MTLKSPVEYSCAPYGKIATIPAGTRCDPARNLPAENGIRKYWARGWRGMSAEEKSWQRNYGFLITVSA